MNLIVISIATTDIALAAVFVGALAFVMGGIASGVADWWRARR